MNAVNSNVYVNASGEAIDLVDDINDMKDAIELIDTAQLGLTNPKELYAHEKRVLNTTIGIAQGKMWGVYSRLEEIALANQRHEVLKHVTKKGGASALETGATLSTQAPKEGQRAEIYSDQLDGASPPLDGMSPKALKAAGFDVIGVRDQLCTLRHAMAAARLAVSGIDITIEDDEQEGILGILDRALDDLREVEDTIGAFQERIVQ